MPRKEKNRAKDRKYHYTYLITDKINNKFYYGVHSTDHDPEDIHQYHSSSKHLKLMVRELGIDNFTKEVRRYFNSREEADKWEHKVLRRLGVRLRKDFYNQSEGGVGYVTSGFVVVKCLKTGKILRVPCDDEYIGILYEHQGKGRKLSESQKQALSDYYKGTREGENNPVHKIKDPTKWRQNISDSVSGRSLSEEQILQLKNPSQWKHLQKCTVTQEVRERMNFHKAINNNKYANIYLYKGDVYLHVEDLPVCSTNTDVDVIPCHHPLISILKAGENFYPDIKTAAECIGVSRTTISNRIKNPHECWDQYYYLPEDVITRNKVESEKSFKESLYEIHKDRLEEQRNYIKPFYVGDLTDDVCHKLFMSTGNFLSGSKFKRLDEKDSFGCHTYFEFYCPVCSEDFYVESGICSGVFKTSYKSLKKGSLPCRCGDSRIISKDIYLFHVEALCVKEGLQFVGLNGDWCGKKMSKINFKCRKGNLHSSTYVGNFLERGSRCKCCVNDNKLTPPEKINLTKIFKRRYDDFRQENTIDIQTPEM